MTNLALNMQPEYAIGLQPILDQTGNLAGYEVLAHVSGAMVAPDTPFRPLSAPIIADLFGNRGIGDVMQSYPWWIKVTPEVLGDDILEALPAGSLVLELRGQHWNPSTAAHCERIRSRGHKVVCWTGPREYLDLAAIAPAVDGIKVTFSDCRLENASAYVNGFRPLRVPIIAESVNHPEIARICMMNGCRFSQGFHFARPVARASMPLEASETALLQLLGLAMSDASSSEIVEVLKTQPDLSIRLLKLLNSAAFRNVAPPASLSQAVAMLGRERLKRWILVLMFEHSRHAGVRFPSPHLMLAAMRGRMMELTAKEIGSGQDPSPEEAFLVGMLSVMSAQFQKPNEDLMQMLSPAPVIREALLHRAGPLGALLFLVEEIEQPGFLDAQFSLPYLDELPASTIVDLQVSAALWAFSLA